MSAEAVLFAQHSRLVALRGELTELAFELDQRGSGDAADVAMMIAARLGELCIEIHSPRETTPTPSACIPTKPSPATV